LARKRELRFLKEFALSDKRLFGTQVP